MNEIVEKFKYLIEKAKYFQELKDNESFLFSELVKVPKSDIEEIKKFYESNKEVEKIKKIRVETCSLLLNDSFSESNFDDLKSQINSQYETNILQSWKNYSILYVFFFNPIKEKVNKYLEDIGNYLLEQSSVKLKLKTTNFDGAQNFGEVGCWLALYNPKYKSQSEGTQYFINFYYQNTTYGTYQHQSKVDIKRMKYDIENLNEDLIQAIVEDIQLQANIILEEVKENGAKVSQNFNQTQPLNQILYGPPGTGKTYHTINKAIEIIENGIVAEDEKRENLKAKFEKYKQNGQIEFVTFHQSYGYEEFVEGIKAKTTKEGIEYKIEAGIFKTLSNKAQLDYALSYIKENLPLELKTSSGITFSITSSTESSLKLVTSKSTEQDIQIRDLYILLKNFNQDVHNSSYAKPCFEYLMNINEKANTSAKNYILIIDEINRGNISKIFGELITLIEPSKRIGEEESLHVKLPYSNEPFGVPSNLYIIGTMNTADRSIALMDTALRRRFDFEEMMPRPDLLENISVGDINIKTLLETINKRIEYLYDRDHTIGHAYFMSLKDDKIADKKAELDNIFKNKIIPLLQEYFYDDWEKIQIVLGDHYSQINKKENYNGEDCQDFDEDTNQIRFIQSIKVKEKDIIGFNHEDIEDESKDYRVNPNKDGFPKEAYLRLCQSK